MYFAVYLTTKKKHLFLISSWSVCSWPEYVTNGHERKHFCNVENIGSNRRRPKPIALGVFCWASIDLYVQKGSRNTMLSFTFILYLFSSWSTWTGRTGRASSAPRLLRRQATTTGRLMAPTMPWQPLHQWPRNTSTKLSVRRLATTEARRLGAVMCLCLWILFRRYSTLPKTMMYSVVKLSLYLSNGYTLHLGKLCLIAI